MKINVADKYYNNISKKYRTESFKSSSKLSDKEKLMWTFTLWLIKDYYPKEIWDTVEDGEFLARHLAHFLVGDWGETFTLKEWDDYLSSK